MKRLDTRIGKMFSLALLGGAALAGCVDYELEVEPLEEDSSPLIGGTATNARPEIGRISNCTATLVDSRYVVSAAHCFDYATGPYSDWFQTRTAAGDWLPALGIDRVYSLGSGPGAADIAFARLTSAFPGSWAQPASFGRAPARNELVSVFGYGCQNRTTETGGGFKQFVDYAFGNTTVGCPGDSGGPRVLDWHTGTGSIWGINSAYRTSDGIDINADATTYGPMVLAAVKAFGGTDVTNQAVAHFPSWATAAKVKAVSGDFNGDGRGDIALVGGNGWSTVPVAFGNGAGGFDVTNRSVASFPSWASAAKSAVAADFDGDGDTDIALLGGSGWNTIPVAFSNRDGSFSVTNLQTPNLPGWAQSSGAYAVAGDFDGDGDGDIALVGGSGWSTIPVGFSNRNGTFAQTNHAVASFPGWAQASGARAVVGDFDADGDADIALSGGSSWHSIPVAFSNRSGGFAVSNSGVAHFPEWAQASGVKLVAGDFDGDGDADIAAVGGSSWRTTPFARSNGAGGFEVANLPMAHFPGWANAARFVLAFQADGGGPADLILSGGAGWSTLPVAFLRP